MNRSIRRHEDQTFPVNKLYEEIDRLRTENQRLTEQAEGDRRIIDCLSSARESEQLKATILDSISDGFFSLDREWRVTFINTQGEALLKKTKPEIIGRVLWDVFPEAVGSRFHEEYERAMREQEAVHFEEYYPPHAAWYGVHAYPTSNSLSVYFTDVTERRRSEEELRGNNRRLGLLAWASNQLLLSARPERTLPQLCKEALSELGCEIFIVHLNGAPDKSLRLHSHEGLDDRTVEQVRSLDITHEEPRDIAPTFDHHLQTTELLKVRLCEVARLTACACNPLVYEGAIIGILSFGSQRREDFRSEELALISSFSNQVAIAMGRRLAEEKLRRMHSRQKKYSEQLGVLVRERTAELARANAQLRKRNNVLRALAKQLTETEQRERQRFSEMLHDNLQQLLIAAKFRTTAAQGRGSADEMKADISQANQLLQESITISRSLAYELSPPVLHHSGLAAGLGWLAEHMQKLHGLHVCFDADTSGWPNVPASTSVFLFGVARELLLNVVKHAGVEEAVVQAGHDDGSLWIRVADQGRGFDPGALHLARCPAGLGLFSIRERLSLVRGRLEVESSPGHGACITVRVPCQ